MIQHITIKGLFNKFDYEIPLNAQSEDSITFLTGCNGLGKTTILNMVESVMSADFDYLFSVPFKLFIIKSEQYRLELSPVTVEKRTFLDDNERLDTSVGKAETTYSHIDISCVNEFFHLDTQLKRGVITDAIRPLILFLKAEGCYHIQDSRINPVQKDGRGEISRINENCIWLKQ